ncbi:hypothetical protein G0D98_26085, partial [Pseudomonas savastanoi pv. phaseolicola]|nr:hypothetical protein [Pseudomonas savastanoi pv. phaseolicola]MBN3478781.1 hypothetical protein [Pseudomonas savastanoi pv. phaseolicola]
PIMLRILPLADGVILPQAKQESYFFNRISQKWTLMTDRLRPILLKKSALNSAGEKYAPEIEI